jgi:hypothetical protein
MQGVQFVRVGWERYGAQTELEVATNMSARACVRARHGVLQRLQNDSQNQTDPLGSPSASTGRGAARRPERAALAW